jgi:hypothetical protein
MSAIQSWRQSRTLLVRVTCWTLFRPAVAIAWLSGLCRGLPHGIAIAANWSLPCTFWKSFRLTRFDFSRIRCFVSVRIVWPLFSGNSMVRAIPSKSHPRISFRVSHVPSSTSFFTETAGLIELLVISGGGKTLEIALSMVRENWSRWSLFVLWISPMKSSMYTSSTLRNFLLYVSEDGSLAGRGTMVQSMSIMMASMGCGAMTLLVSKFSCAISRAVSIAAQKNGGDLPHPIWSASGMTSWMGSPGFPPGRT